VSAHQKCLDAGLHICDKPSGRVCIEADCDEAAGTDWGPYWCPECDRRRLDRISGQLASLRAALAPSEPLHG
jgi:hypothetical protein